MWLATLPSAVSTRIVAALSPGFQTVAYVLDRRSTTKSALPASALAIAGRHNPASGPIRGSQAPIDSRHGGT
jgi:hypothetical protein